MSEKLDSFDFSSGRRDGKYDYLLDGSIWRLKRDEDFDGEAATVRATISSAAHRRGKRIRTRILEGGDILILQAFDKEAP